MTSNSVVCFSVLAALCVAGCGDGGTAAVGDAGAFQTGTGAMVGNGGGGAGGAGGAGGQGGQAGTPGGDGDGGDGDGSAAADGGNGGMPSVDAGSSPLPPTDDYAAPGPFDDAMMVSGVGPGGAYTLFRPGASLGRDGFQHPIVTWGNGISTTPAVYEQTLTLIATHGFVIIAANDTQAEEPALTAGLQWLVEQNQSGDMQGLLDTSREATIGYSWGGGAAIDTAYRPNVVATVSMHGMPPRRDDAFTAMHSPLLLFTSTGDSFVSAEEYVTPNYQAATVQTFYATLDDPGAGHLYPADEGSFACIAATLGSCGNAAEERAPMIAWLRLWVYGDMGGRDFFYGDDCKLCTAPWTNPQRKHWP